MLYSRPPRPKIYNCSETLLNSDVTSLAASSTSDSLLICRLCGCRNLQALDGTRGAFFDLLFCKGHSHFTAIDLTVLHVVFYSFAFFFTLKVHKTIPGKNATKTRQCKSQLEINAYFKKGDLNQLTPLKLLCLYLWWFLYWAHLQKRF